MSDQLLNVLKYFLIALIWLFFLRVLRAVWVEVRRTGSDAEAATPRRGEPGGGGSVPQRLAAPVTGAIMREPLATGPGGTGPVPAPPVVPGPQAVGAVVPAAGAGALAGAAVPTPGPAEAGRPSAARGRDGSEPVRLRVVEPPGLAGRSFEVARTATIGRSPSCDLSFDQDNYTSARHARLFFDEGTLWVEDLGSTNGTYVNGSRREGAAPLRRGDHVQVGTTVLEVVG